jgi:hypothetical protein
MRETRLEIAERHVRDGLKIVERQELLVAKQKARGHDTTDQEALLATFKRSLAIFEADLAALRKEGLR